MIFFFFFLQEVNANQDIETLHEEIKSIVLKTLDGELAWPMDKLWTDKKDWYDQLL